MTQPENQIYNFVSVKSKIQIYLTVSKMKFKYFIQYSTKMRIDHFQINTHYRFLNKLLIRRKLQIFIWPQNWNCLTDKLKVFYASLFYFGWNLLTKNEFKMSIGHLKPMLISETLCAFRYSCFHNLFQNNRLIWF